MALQGAKGKISINEEISNTSVNVIKILEDRLENILTKHIHRLTKQSDWKSAMTILGSLITTIVTSDFHDTFGINASTIKDIFCFGIVASFIYFCYTLYNCIKNRDSIERIIKDIENKQ